MKFRTMLPDGDFEKNYVIFKGKTSKQRSSTSSIDSIYISKRIDSKSVLQSRQSFVRFHGKNNKPQIKQKKQQENSLVQILQSKVMI